jgi:hypothetical protein
MTQPCAPDVDAAQATFGPSGHLESRPDPAQGTPEELDSQTVFIVQDEPIWIRVDVESLCVNALAEVRSHVQRVGESQMHWLWVVSALKLALQTFIVGSFGTAAALESMPPKRAEETIRAIRESTPPYPSPWMQSFPDLYNYAKQRHKWVPGSDGAVTLLNDLRKDVEHFIPKAWSIEASGLPEMTRSVLSAIGDLAWGTARALPWHSDELLSEARDLVAGILEDLNDL